MRRQVDPGLFWNLGYLGQRSVGIKILQGVEYTHSFACRCLSLYRDLRIPRPFLDCLFGYSGSQKPFAKLIPLHLCTQPVASFCKAFKGTGRSVDTIVTCIWLGIQAKFLVIIENGAADGSCLFCEMKINGTYFTWSSENISPFGAVEGLVDPSTSPRKDSQVKLSVGHETVYHLIFSPSLQ